MWAPEYYSPNATPSEALEILRMKAVYGLEILAFERIAVAKEGHQLSWTATVQWA